MFFTCNNLLKEILLNVTVRSERLTIKGIKSVMLLPLSSQVKAGKVIFAAQRIKRSLFQPRKGSCGKSYFKI